MATLKGTLTAQTRYLLRAVWLDLSQRKFGTFLTVLVIAMSLTIPTVGYLLWKNTHQASSHFYPEPELTIYLHKSLSEKDAEMVYQQLQQYQADKMASHKYISRQQSLDEFRAWSGFSEPLDVVDDNPLPAVVVIKPKAEFTQADQMLTFRDELQKIKGVQEVRLDNGWLEKLTALTWLIARVAVVCTLLMLITVFLVIGNSVRTDVANQRASIEVQQLLGATSHFIARPFIYTGMIYGFLASLIAALVSFLVIGYFTGAVKYVTDLFTVNFDIHGLNWGELLFLVVGSVFIGWLSALIATNKHIQKLGTRH